MDCTALDKSLLRQVISPVYLFYGEENYLRDVYLDRFKALVPDEVKDFNLDIVDGRETAVGDLVNMAVTLPFMAPRRLVIVKNADYFKSKRKGRQDNAPAKGAEAQALDGGDAESAQDGADDALLRYLEAPPDTTCLILCTDAVDKKRKSYKMAEKNGQVVEFTPLKGRELNEWINKRSRNLGKVIEPAAVAGLITAVGNNLCQLNCELEKLACYALNEKITAPDVEYMVSRTVELSIFELVDAVGERNYKKAIRMAREMVFLGEPVIRMLFMIARQFRLILQAKSLAASGLADKQVAAELKVHPFVAQKCTRQARNFPLAELRLAMEKILAADASIKSGRQEPMLAMEMLIINLCDKTSAKI